MRFPRIALLSASLVLAACSSSTIPASEPAGGGSGEPAPSFSQFSDVPVPEGAHMDVDRTVLLGQGQNWTGRLVFNVRWTDAASLYDLYKSQMPRFGWREIASVRASISVMTWQRGDRICTIQISDTTFGAEVLMTMAPVNGATAPAAGDASQPPPPPATTGVPEPPPVSAQPLK